jgi:hypothetical protein
MMRAGRVAAIAGVVAGLVGLVAITTAQAQSGSDGRSGSDAGSQPSLPQVPLASAAGGGSVSLVYPSVVAVHLDRSRAAIARAEAAFDDPKNTVRAANQMGNARVQMFDAWKATKYVIKTTPPPPPPQDRAGTSGGAASGPTFASPPDTSFALFDLQHDLVTHAAGLLGNDATLDGRLTGVMQKTATLRDAAIAYIHAVAPPPPPPGDKAGASGGAVGVTFDTTMPTVLPLLDDEIQALTGTLALHKTLPAGVKTALQGLINTDNQTKATINTFWPPIVGDD